MLWTLPGGLSGSSSPVGQSSFLSAVKDDDSTVAFGRRVVRTVVRRNLQDASAMLELYTPFEYLLVEEQRLGQYLASSPAPTLKDCEGLISKVLLGVAAWLVALLLRWLVGWLVCCFVGWLVGWLLCCFVGCFVAWGCRTSK